MDMVSPLTAVGNPLTKRCSTCRQLLDVSCFNKDRNSPDGLSYLCKVCRKTYRKAHPDKPPTPEYHKIRMERQQAKRDTLVTKTCIECGNSYQDRNGEGKVCSQCKPVRRQRFRPPTFMTCARCGQEFGPVDHLGRKYCSAQCRRASIKGSSNRKRGRKYPHTQRAAVRKCLTCGTEFRGVKDTAKRPQLYCSHQCYLRNRRVSQFEARVMALLTSYGVPLETQAKRGRWTFDAAVIGTSILVEADGAFWHGPQRIKDRDMRKNAWCQEHGYILLRVPELEFYKTPDEMVLPIVKRWEAETGQTAVLLSRAEAG